MSNRRHTVDCAECLFERLIATFVSTNLFLQRCLLGLSLSCNRPCLLTTSRFFESTPVNCSDHWLNQQSLVESNPFDRTATALKPFTHFAIRGIVYSLRVKYQTSSAHGNQNYLITALKIGHSRARQHITSTLTDARLHALTHTTSHGTILTHRHLRACRGNRPVTTR